MISGDPDMSTAVHEAAHAVAMIHLGGEGAHVVVDSISARADRRGAPARVIYRESALAAPETIVSLLAGPEAAWLAGERFPYWGGRQDAGDALSAAISLCPPDNPPTSLDKAIENAWPILKQLQGNTATLVSLLWSEINAGARALLAAPNKTMSGVEFAAAAGGRIGWYAEQGAKNGPDVINESSYTSELACASCGLRVPLPARAAALLTSEETAAWAAMVAREFGHSCE